MKSFKHLIFAAFLAVLPFAALADGYKLATSKFPDEFPVLLAASIGSGDYTAVWDASAGDWRKVDATALPLGGAFNGTVGGVTPAAGAFTTISGTGTLTLDDGTGASPSQSFIDETNETAIFSKVDAGYLTLTTDATDGLNVLVGNLKVGNGTPGLTQGGEDGYVEGTFEVDGATQLDGALAVAGTATLSGDVIGDGGDQLVGFLTNQVTATATTITAAQCGTTFINAGAIEMELPEASTVVGCRLTFVVNNASNFTIDPDAADIILIATNAAGDSLIADLPGESITIQAIDGTNWAPIGTPYGTWTDSN